MQCIACNGTGRDDLAATCPICKWVNRAAADKGAISRHIHLHHTMHEIHTAMSRGKLSLTGGKYTVAADPACGICQGTGHVCDTCGESIPDDGDYLCIDCGGGE